MHGKRATSAEAPRDCLTEPSSSPPLALTPPPCPDAAADPPTGMRACQPAQVPSPHPPALATRMLMPPSLSDASWIDFSTPSRSRTCGRRWRDE